MLHVSFAYTSPSYAAGVKTETRRFWKASHAAKFKPGTLFMGVTKDFRAGGVIIHPAMVISIEKQYLRDMRVASFKREGGTRHWASRKAYIEAMGGPDKCPYALRFEHRAGETPCLK